MKRNPVYTNNFWNADDNLPILYNCREIIGPSMAKRGKKTKAPVSDGRERRRYPRHPNPDLVVNIGGKLIKVCDVSATGLSVENVEPPSEDLTVVVYRCHDNKLDLNHALRLHGVVIRHGDRKIGIRIDPASLALTRLVVDE